MRIPLKNKNKKNLYINIFLKFNRSIYKSNIFADTVFQKCFPFAEQFIMGKNERCSWREQLHILNINFTRYFLYHILF